MQTFSEEPQDQDLAGVRTTEVHRSGGWAARQLQQSSQPSWCRPLKLRWTSDALKWDKGITSVPAQGQELGEGGPLGRAAPPQLKVVPGWGRGGGEFSSEPSAASVHK